MRLGNVGTLECCVAFGLDPLEGATRRLGTVTGVSSLPFQFGDRLTLGLDLGSNRRLAAAERLQLRLPLAEPFLQGDQVGTCPDRRILGGDPTALLLGQLAPRVALGSLLVAAFDEPADVFFPAGFLTQPGDADLVDQPR